MYMYTEIDSSRAPPNIITQYINLEKGTARNEEQIRPIPFLPPIDEAIDGTSSSFGPSGDRHMYDPES